MNSNTIQKIVMSLLLQTNMLFRQLVPIPVWRLVLSGAFIIKSYYSHKNMGQNYLSIPRRQRLQSWSLEMLGLKLIYVSKSDPSHVISETSKTGFREIWIPKEKMSFSAIHLENVVCKINSYILSRSQCFVDGVILEAGWCPVTCIVFSGIRIPIMLKKIFS